MTTIYDLLLSSTDNAVSHFDFEKYLLKVINNSTYGITDDTLLCIDYLFDCHKYNLTTPDMMCGFYNMVNSMKTAIPSHVERIVSSFINYGLVPSKLDYTIIKERSKYINSIYTLYHTLLIYGANPRDIKKLANGNSRHTTLVESALKDFHMLKETRKTNFTNILTKICNKTLKDINIINKIFEYDGGLSIIKKYPTYSILKKTKRIDQLKTDGWSSKKIKHILTEGLSFRDEVESYIVGRKEYFQTTDYLQSKYIQVMTYLNKIKDDDYTEDDIILLKGVGYEKKCNKQNEFFNSYTKEGFEEIIKLRFAEHGDKVRILAIEDEGDPGKYLDRLNDALVSVAKIIIQPLYQKGHATGLLIEKLVGGYALNLYYINSECKALDASIYEKIIGNFEAYGYSTNFTEIFQQQKHSDTCCVVFTEECFKLITGKEGYREEEAAIYYNILYEKALQKEGANKAVDVVGENAKTLDIKATAQHEHEVKVHLATVLVMMAQYYNQGENQQEEIKEIDFANVNIALIPEQNVTTVEEITTHDVMDYLYMLGTAQ